MADVTAATVRDLAFAHGDDDGIRLKLVTVAGPEDYTTGGDGLLGTGFKKIFGVISIGDPGGYMATWVADLLKIYTGDYDPAADSPFVECDLHADLHLVTFTFLVIGV